MSSKRIEWLDIAKGLGMIFVILGHAVGFGTPPHNIIFAFHMPLFFMLSGFVHKPCELGVLLKKRARSLLLPYFLFFALGTVIALVFSGLTLKEWLSDLYYGNPEHTFVSSVWFLIAMFFVDILFELILRIKQKWLQYTAVLTISAAGIAFGELYIYGTIKFRLMLDLDVVPVALFFFAAGYYVKPFLRDTVEKFKGRSKLAQAGIFAGIGIVFMVTVVLNGRVNLHGITYGNPLLFIIGGLTGSAALIIVSIWAESSPFKSSLIYFGENTIYILGAQAIGIRVMMSLINRLLGRSYPLYGLPYVWAAGDRYDKKER
jgi:fucose 4-O-acetylase-like acetyltransferase